MNEFQHTDTKGNNINKLFAVLIVLIVVALFIQGVYIHRLTKQIKHSSENQGPIGFVEKTNPLLLL